MREWSLRLRGGAKHVAGKTIVCGYLDEGGSARGMELNRCSVKTLGYFQFGPEYYEMA